MKKKPHIIIFNPDQWRGDVLGHLGNKAALTPNLDALIEHDGVSFSNAFCQNTVCTPSRCSFMTGWYPHVRGHRTMYHMLHRDHGEPMLLNILKENGYHVFWGGKNDVVPGQESMKPFTDSITDLSKYPLDPNPHGPVYASARGKPGEDSYYSFFIGQLNKRSGEDYYHDPDWAHVMAAKKLIQDRPKDQPLCIYLPLVYPHPPYGVEEPFFSAINRGLLPKRIPAPSSWKGKPSQLEPLFKNFNLAGWTEERWNELRAVYYGMCMRMDALFGDLINTLKQEGIYDETAIFLFSDHGDFTGDYGLVEKTQNTFEDCLTRVPFVVKPPKDIPVKSGINHSLVELVDFSETVYDMTGLNPQYSRFGKSLIPLLGKGDEVTHRDAVFCEGGRLENERHCMELESHNTKNFTQHDYWPRLSLQADSNPTYHTKAAMCRTKDLKYVRRFYEKDALYDLQKDPGETINLIDDPTYSNALSKLKDRMLSWYMETCDVVPFQPDNR